MNLADSVDGRTKRPYRLRRCRTSEHLRTPGLQTRRRKSYSLVQDRRLSALRSRCLRCLAAAKNRAGVGPICRHCPRGAQGFLKRNLNPSCANHPHHWPERRAHRARLAIFTAFHFPSSIIWSPSIESLTSLPCGRDILIKSSETFVKTPENGARKPRSSHEGARFQ